MRTCDRAPGPNYLRKTFDNARRAGFFQSPHLTSFDVVVSPPVTKSLRRALSLAPDFVTVHEARRALTPNEAATEAHALANWRGADYVLFLEDDLDFCSDFLGSVARWLEDHDNTNVRDEGYPLFVFGHVLGGHPRATAEEWKASGFYGTQCYAVPKERHGHLVEWLSENPQYDDGRGTRVNRCHDLRLHNWADEIGAQFFLATSPSFVSHIGEVSGMGCPPVIFKSWPGRDWTYKGREAA